MIEWIRLTWLIKLIWIMQFKFFSMNYFTNVVNWIELIEGINWMWWYNDDIRCKHCTIWRVWGARSTCRWCTWSSTPSSRPLCPRTADSVVTFWTLSATIRASWTSRKTRTPNTGTWPSTSPGSTSSLPIPTAGRTLLPWVPHWITN